MEQAVAERVRAPAYEFDYYRDRHVAADIHDGYMRLKKDAPPLFWTECNGGHWVATSGALVNEALRQPEIFSSKYLSIPLNPALPKLVPQMVDPPEHRFYQKLLRPFFELRAVEKMEPRIRALAAEKIDAVIARGQCEFVNDVGSHFALSMFMELMGFPTDQFETFRELEFAFFAKATDRAEQARVSGAIMHLLGQLIDARTAEPKDDWISAFIHEEFDGRPLTRPELLSMGFMMFLAGLDTVVNALAFGMRHLGNDAALQQQIIDDPELLPDVVEELMRRYAFISLPRYVTEDVELGGIQLRAGDSILLPLMMLGWETECPEEVTLDRAPCRHAAFGSGVHTCPGIHFARREMIVFYRIWLEKIGRFGEVQPLERPLMRIGTVNAVPEVHLAWPG